MNKIQLVSFIIMTSIILGGCATYGELSALSTDGLKIVHEGDSEILISERTNTVSLSPKIKNIRSGKRGDFILTIENKSLNDIPFSIDDILVTSHDVTSDKKIVLDVFSREDLISKEKSSQKTSEVWGVIGSVIYAFDAAAKQGTNSHSSSMEQLNKHKEDLVKSRNDHEETLRLLESHIPNNTMIPSGEKISGLVRVRLPKVTDVSKNILFAINLDEEHTLTFIHKKVEKQ